MATFEKDEYLEMVLLYGECARNARAAARLYAARFPDRRHPDHRVILRTVARLQETGAFTGRPRTGRTPQNRDRAALALQAFRDNPQASTRSVGRDLDMPHTAVWRVLREHHYHPYRIHLHQELRANDYIRRVTFCTWALLQIGRNPHFLSSILTSDESTFYRDGNVHRHNMHYWSATNPHWLRILHHQDNWRFNVWCGIHGDSVVGPIFLDGNLNAVRYLQILETVVAPYVDGRPLAEYFNVWFQQDGASPHYQRDVRNWLDTFFPDRWIGRGGPTPWPARSPDLTPLDFFLWGYIKSQVYETEPASIADLQGRIRQACANIPLEMLRNVRRTWRKRLRDCITARGGHFEHFY